jgi:hypothetical protein
MKADVTIQVLRYELASEPDWIGAVMGSQFVDESTYEQRVNADDIQEGEQKMLFARDNKHMLITTVVRKKLVNQVQD